MRLKCLKEQYKRMRKHHVDCREHQEKGKLVSSTVRKNINDYEMIIAIAKQEVSDITEYVVTKTRQPEKQLLESLEIARKKKNRTNQLG